MSASSGMGKHIVVIAVIAALVCIGIAMAGCNGYEPQSSEDGALQYYQDKYYGKTAIAESHGLGDYHLFGYSYNGMEYIMADGTSVVYYDDEGVYRDNRQTAEIQQAAVAFAEDKLAAIPGAVTPVQVERVGSNPHFETYDGEGVCWHAYYDGDIEAFLQEEQPSLILENHYSCEVHADGRFYYSVAYDESQAADLEDAYLALSRFFDIRPVTLAVVDRSAFEASGGALTLFDDGLRYTVSFNGDSASGVEAVREKPAFIQVRDGIEVSSSTAGVTLKEGDLRFIPTEDGFTECRISGEAASCDTMSYYIHNDTDATILKVNGIDEFSLVCDPYQHRDYCTLSDGGVYFIGDKSAVTPQVEIESVTADKVVARYHTFFKDQISNVSLRVIGSASKDGSGNISTFTSTEFKSRIVGETDDGWRCEVAVPEGARKDNTLCFQFTYDNDKDVSVQIEQPIVLP